MAVFSGNGSNTSPSFTFSSDTNSGLYRIGEDNIGIATGGALAAQVDSSGRVGINTAPSYRLDVANATTDDVFRTKNTTTTSANVSRFYNDSNNGVNVVAYGSAYPASSTFSIGANGSVLSSAGGPLAISADSGSLRIGIGSSTQIAHVNSTGFGIGTTNPAGMLDVSGTNRINNTNFYSTSTQKIPAYTTTISITDLGVLAEITIAINVSASVTSAQARYLVSGDPSATNDRKSLSTILQTAAGAASWANLTKIVGGMSVDLTVSAGNNSGIFVMVQQYGIGNPTITFS